MVSELLKPEVVANLEWLAVYGTLLIGALTTRQRLAIRKRDEEFGVKVPGNKGICQLPVQHDCNGDKEINVHHIRPQRYCFRLGIDPDYPENTISICSNGHVGDPTRVDGGSIHPDTFRAKQEFHADSKSFEKMSHERDKKLDQKQPYWNTTHDRKLDVLAVRNSQKARLKAWIFPPKK